MTMMKEVTHTFLVVFYIIPLLLELSAIIINDITLALCLRLINTIVTMITYYMRRVSTTEKRIKFFSWYIIGFSMVDILFYLFILILFNRNPLICIPLIVSICRLLYEYRIPLREFTPLYKSHVEHVIV